MEKFTLHVLGCGSALPTTLHAPSSQVLSLREKLYMIDCGEGTQVQLRRAGLRFSRLNHVFITHLHGDHFFGLIGMLSTFSLLGRTTPLHLYAPAALENVLRLELDAFCQGMEYEVDFHAVDPSKAETIMENKALSVSTIPLRHRIPCCGYLFREQPSLPHIRRDMIDFYDIPLYAINDIKAGADWVTPEGECVSHHRLVEPAAPPRAFAYCSDTLYHPETARLVAGVDLLYHEATFGSELEARARETFHSTARQAAMVARDAGVGRLLIGHYSARYTDTAPLLAEAQAVFANTTAAREGLRLDIG